MLLLAKPKPLCCFKLNLCAPSEKVEEHGLGGKKMKFYECNQLPGEIIYIPAATIQTSLNLLDSLSYKQDIAVSSEAMLTSTKVLALLAQKCKY